MQAKAKLRFLRISPKKVRLVIDLIRGLKVEEAIVQLNVLDKGAKRPILKLLNSAIANAENNFELKKDNLFIKEIRVDKGGVLKRWKPRAHGKAAPIRKKLSHVCLVLDELVPSKSKKKVKKQVKEKPVRMESKETVKSIKQQIKPKDQIKPKGHEKEQDQDIQDVRMEGKHRHQQHQDKRQMKKSDGFIRKIFNRKAG